MDSALLRRYHVSRSTKWSLYAGLYMFVVGVISAALLSDLLVLLADVIGVPPSNSRVVFASPAILIGAGTWWIVVERQGSYTYRLGALFGLVTALLTGLVWTARFVDVWGIEMVVIPIVSFFVVYVLGLTILTGVLTGLPLMYARRRLRGGNTG